MGAGASVEMDSETAAQLHVPIQINNPPNPKIHSCPMSLQRSSGWIACDYCGSDINEGNYKYNCPTCGFGGVDMCMVRFTNWYHPTT